MKLKEKNTLRQKRRWRIRKKVSGTPERPRLTVRFSNKHIYAQCVDDRAGHTLVYASSLAENGPLKANREGAASLGKTLAEKAKSAGIGEVVFDRAGRRYHGCVRAFADAARENGLQF